MSASLSQPAEPRLDFVMCASPAGTHRMAYWEWGDPDNDRVVLCVHGLTRTGRDFDELAKRLCSDYRVVCPDIVGRGRSDWLIDPGMYVVPQYAADVLTLIARLRPAALDWVGTSMGGLIGLVLAGTLAASELRRPGRGSAGLPPECTVALQRLVLNDIGPVLDPEGLQRIASYVGTPMDFGSFDAAVDYVRSVSPGFGPHDAEGWRALTRHVFTESGGRWTKHYDLRIAQPFALQTPQVMAASEIALWAAYESIDAPVLILRGESSDVLSEQAANDMLARNPRATLRTIAGVGHAPTLRSDDQTRLVADFLSPH